MGKLPVALQVYSVRADAEKDFEGTMRRIKDAGYEGVELAGLYGNSPEEVRAVLDKLELPAISAHVPYALLSEDMEGTVKAYQTIGCRYIAIPYLADEHRPGSAMFAQVIENIKQIGACCNAHGITLLYHNHEFEFVKMPDGSFGLDYLYAHVGAELLQTELDMCWVKVAGQEPARYLERYADRAPVVHLKDFRMHGDKMPEKLYELIGIPSGEQSVRSSFSFQPVGHGMQDMPTILAAVDKTNAKWLVVEQDASVERSDMEAAVMSRDYLRAQGY